MWLAEMQEDGDCLFDTEHFGAPQLGTTFSFLSGFPVNEDTLVLCGIEWSLDWSNDVTQLIVPHWMTLK